MSAFQHIDTWVFDLDNTLYPASCRLFDQIDKRMGDFVSKFLAMPYADAKLYQKQLYYKHGTTLRGLMIEHDLDPKGFLAEVHNIDYSPVPPNPQLAMEIKKLPGRKLIFTAGSVKHAENTLNRLGLNNLFEDIFDITHANYIPKPQRPAYETFLAKHGVTPNTSIMFEDIARNLEVPHALGMATVLITHDDNKDAIYLNADHDAAYIKHRTNDITQFLKDATAP
jgi:putative hydrolase of the HAD superfamily